MSYNGYGSMEVCMELERLAREVGLTQIDPGALHCAACFDILWLSDRIYRVPISHKRALNKPAHHDGSAIAYLCGKCKDENKEPVFVFHREGSQRRRFVEVNIEDLPDK